MEIPWKIELFKERYNSSSLSKIIFVFYKIMFNKYKSITQL